MAFSNQFSLSLELTKLLPLGFLVDTGGRALIQFAKELRKAGSDFVVEADLADVFGRNRINPQFESSFKTAVRGSDIVRLPSLVDVVLEVGAGPTVRRAIADRAYLATVVQISLLTWSHDLHTLTRALAKALEQRAANDTSQADVPDHDALGGTLLACRDQTSGYKWDLVFSAVEYRLFETDTHPANIRDLRQLPFAVLQALLDTFTAIQHFPEQRLLRINTYRGVSTIIVWAHHVLGLTVSVHVGQKNVARFGEGLEQVLIHWFQQGQEGPGHDQAEVLLLSSLESDDADFHLSSQATDYQGLTAACHHPVRGYGCKLLIAENARSPELIQELARSVIASAIWLVIEADAKLANAGQLPRNLEHIPSRWTILDVGALLFPNVDCSPAAIDELASVSCPIRLPWTEEHMPPMLFNSLRRYYQDTKSLKRTDQVTLENSETIPENCTPAPALYLRHILCRLCAVLLTISMVGNLSDCAELPLDIHSDPYNSWNEHRIRLYDCKEAFVYLSRLLGSETYHLESISKAAVVCHMGWSLVLGSIDCVAPALVRNQVFVHRGVPSRKHERKYWIIDGGPRNVTVLNDPTMGLYRNEKGPHRQVVLGSMTAAKYQKPLVGVYGNAFDVVQHIRMGPVGTDADTWAHVKTGLREMQDLCWDAVKLPGCGHMSKIGETVYFPEAVSPFSGWRTSRYAKEGSYDSNALHVGLVAGNDPAQWGLLLNIPVWDWVNWEGKDEPPVVYLRGNDCCAPCAAKVAQNDRPGYAKVVVL